MSEDADTRTRVLTQNCRRSSIVELIPSHKWSRRRANMITHIKRVDPSVMLLQECTDEQAADLNRGLAETWTWVGEKDPKKDHHNVKVFWRSDRWDAIEGSYYEQVMESGAVLGVKRNRYAVGIQLISRKTSEPVWFVSTHLAAYNESRAEYWRPKQMAQVISRLKTLPGWECSAVGGDLNDYQQNGGPRAIAHVLGFDGLRARVPREQWTRRNHNTSQHFKKTQLEGQHIDDILTPERVVPYAAAVEVTDPDAYTPPASDHNGVLGRIAF